MKVAAFSDCHSLHRELRIPKDIDLIAVAGDWTNWGRIEEAQAFLDWLALQPAKYKVVVPGNHDFICEKAHGLIQKTCEERGLIFLVDREVEIEGKRIWGSPRTPWFGDYAFVYDPADAQYLWEQLIPDGLDLLITHGPPFKILDETRGTHAGCKDLLIDIEKKKPRFHIFGHIHQGYGSFNNGTTQFYNVAVMHAKLGIANPITVFDI